MYYLHCHDNGFVYMHACLFMNKHGVQGVNCNISQSEILLHKIHITYLMASKCTWELSITICMAG